MHERVENAGTQIQTATHFPRLLRTCSAMRYAACLTLQQFFISIKTYTLLWSECLHSAVKGG